MRARLLASLLIAGGLVGGAVAQSPAPNTPAPSGYLGVAAPDTLKIMPPPPAAHSPREAADRDVFARTRALAGTPRFTLATIDADLTPGAGMFSCAVGADLTRANAPILSAMFRKLGADVYAVTEPAKDHYARARPYTWPDAANAPICVPKTDALTKNPSYPSGHAAISWTWGSILAELAPDRATQILARARGIGDSRVVCGVHYLSDIEAGRTSGASLVAALHGDAAFRADLERARVELAAVRAAPHSAPANCAVQNEAAEHAPY